MLTSRFSRFLFAVSATSTLSLAFSTQGFAATDSWTAAGGGSWSVSSNWSPTSVPGVGTTADVVNLNDTSTSRTIVFDNAMDTGANVSTGLAYIKVASVNYNQVTTGSVVNMLDIAAPSPAFSTSVPSLWITGGLTVGANDGLQLDPALASSSGVGAPVVLDLGSTGTNGTLTLTTGGLVNMYAYSYQPVMGNTSGYVSEQANISGNVVNTGGTLTAGNITTNNSTQVGIGAPTDNILGTYTQSGGTAVLNLAGQGTTLLGLRLAVSGNFISTGGTIEATGGATQGGLILQGASNSITNTVVNTPNPGGLVFSAQQLSLWGTQNQSFTSDATFTGTLSARNFGANVTYVKNINTNTSAGNQMTGQISYQISSIGGGAAIQLASDLYNSATSPFLLAGNTTSNSTMVAAIDLAGHNLNLTAGPLSLGNASTSATNWYILNTSTNTSTVTSTTINLAAANSSNIGNGAGALSVSGGSLTSTGAIILQATSSGGAINLGFNTAGTGALTTSNALPSNVTMFYNPTTGTSGTAGTLTSNRTIGGVHVGFTGTSTSSKLQLASAITATGNVQTDASSILDLNGKALTLSSAANLQGAGTVNSSASGASIGITGTGGVSAGSGSGSIGTLSLSSTNFTGLTLNVNSVSTFDIAGTTAGNFDVLSLGGAAITYAGSTLTLNFMSYTPNAGDSFAIVTGSGTISGTWATINSNISGDTFSYTPGTGILTVVSVPEPSSLLLLALAASLGLALKLTPRLRRVLCRY